MPIKLSELESLVQRINVVTKNPLAYNEIGNYQLDMAYGGYKLVQIINEHGGQRNISTDGYGTKRQLYSWMISYLSGIEVIGYIKH